MAKSFGGYEFLFVEVLIIFFLYVWVVGDDGWENKLNKIIVQIKRANKTVVTIPRLNIFL